MRSRKVSKRLWLRVLRSSFALVILACSAMRNNAHAGDTAAPSILVELFTSEGCSSCPPVDAWVQKMDSSQPVPGARLIVLSEHVDYWNDGGWKDPYSSAFFTNRQSTYCRKLGVTDPYTPQVIVDGSAELRLRDQNQVSQVFQTAAAVRQLRVHIGPVTVEANSQPSVKTRIEADADSQTRNADVYVAVALDHADSEVLHGENSGRHLTHVAVVESLKKIGRLAAGQSFSEEFEAKLKPGTDPANLRIIAFVQEAGGGKVLGSALQKAPF